VSWLQAPDYWLARLLYERSLAALYLIAFLVALNQFRPLLGENGLLPVPRFIPLVRLRDAPSLFHFRYSDRLLAVVAWSGIVLSALLLAGVPDRLSDWAPMLIWPVLWVLYLSIVNVGQTFYAFGWESLLLEMGALAALLGGGRTAPPLLMLYLLRWLLFRLEFGAGLIKLRGDPCWRNLTCLYYHHETQPMPNPFSWYFHHLPKPLHKVEVLGNHFAQLIVPFGLFAPQPVADIAAGIIIVTQLWLVLSGNFSWLNFGAIVLAFSALDDRVLGVALPLKPHPVAPLPVWWTALTIGMTLLVAVLSIWPVRNMLSPSQLMNYSFNRFHFVNAYGAFGSVTKVRYEVTLEGAATEVDLAAGEWHEYGFKGKPGDPWRRPPQVAPYHLRLDWLMWFAAMSMPFQHPWLEALVEKLLRNDPAILKLIRHNPFPQEPPRYVRARLYRYRFTTWQERRETGAWWHRSLAGEYLPVMALRFPA